VLVIPAELDDVMAAGATSAAPATSGRTS